MIYKLKQKPADFIVREEISFPLTGEGEHLWLRVKKQNLTTDVARSLLAKAFALDARNIGAAGKKDRHAVTYQWFSLHSPGKATALQKTALETLQNHLENHPLYDGESLEIEESQVHNKKCQVGCHSGNRFEIFIQLEKYDVSHDRLNEILEQISSNGFPNYFGEQRFGLEQVTLESLDQQLARMKSKSKRGRLKPKDAWICSQARAALFNQLLELRQKEDCWRKLIPGDVLNLRGSQSCFKVSQDDDVSDLQSRLDRGDVIPTGPLYGRQEKQVCPEGQIKLLEDQIWATLSSLAQETLLQLQVSARRPLWVFPLELSCKREKDGLRCHFWLPNGAYATELVKYLVQLIL